MFFVRSEVLKKLGQSELGKEEVATYKHAKE